MLVLFAQCAHLPWLLARVIDNIEWRCHLTSAAKGAVGVAFYLCLPR